jgi:hypothetical protein
VEACEDFWQDLQVIINDLSKRLELIAAGRGYIKQALDGGYPQLAATFDTKMDALVRSINAVIAKAENIQHEIKDAVSYDGVSPDEARLIRGDINGTLKALFNEYVRDDSAVRALFPNAHGFGETNISRPGVSPILAIPAILAPHLDIPNTEHIPPGHGLGPDVQNAAVVETTSEAIPGWLETTTLDITTCERLNEWFKGLVDFTVQELKYIDENFNGAYKQLSILEVHGIADKGTAENFMKAVAKLQVDIETFRDAVKAIDGEVVLATKDGVLNAGEILSIKNHLVILGKYYKGLLDSIALTNTIFDEAVHKPWI